MDEKEIILIVALGGWIIVGLAFFIGSIIYGMKTKPKGRRMK